MERFLGKSFQMRFFKNLKHGKGKSINKDGEIVENIWHCGKIQEESECSDKE